MESLFAELASNGVLTAPPKVELADYLGGYSYMGATLEKAGIIPDPSMAQVGCWGRVAEAVHPRPHSMGLQEGPELQR